MEGLVTRFFRTVASYIPSKSLLGPRNLKDLPRRVLGKPHDEDFLPFHTFVPSEPIVIDVGANRGQSIESFRATLPGCAIHAVEPNPVLSLSLAIRYPDVQIYPVALGTTSGKFKLYIPRYGFNYWDTRASLDRKTAASFLCKENFFAFIAERAVVETLEVPVETLDSLNLTPDIIKIDAEGFEAEVLAGGDRTLRDQPVVMVEGNDRRVVDALLPLGYTAFHANGRSLTRGPGNRNTFFLTRRHIGSFEIR